MTGPTLWLTAYLAGSYLVGAIPWGLILARLAAGVNVRQVGSGNIGATNVLRSVGKSMAVLTLLLDVAKAAAPTWLGLYWGEDVTVAAAGGLAALIGHCFPVYLGFKGGKGVACALGMFVVLSPLTVLVGVVVFVAAVLITKIVSIGSLAGVLTAVPMLAWLERNPALTAIIAVAAGVIFLQHRANLVRLIRGEEHRLGRGQAA